MRKYSKTYKVGKKSFRYNYEDKVLEYFHKPSSLELDMMIADNTEWVQKHGHPLWTSDELGGLIDSIGLSEENWKESPMYWCEQYAEELNWVIADAEREFNGKN